MPPKSRFFNRSVRYRSARVAALAWGLATLLNLAGLVAFGALIGYGANKLHWSQPFESIARIATEPAVAAVVAFVILVAMSWWCRLSRLAWLTWKPGQIVVPDFKAGSALQGVTAAQLTTEFRNRLAQLRLQSAAPTPGASPAGPFAEVLPTDSVSSGDVWKTVIALLRAAIPSYAIQVQGVLREREGANRDRYGVTVQATLPDEASAPLEVWEKSWERALKAAADGITAAILPRTRACRGPWAAWRGYEMPHDLLASYEAAAEQEQKGCYDAALERYLTALKLDPANVQVRLHLGQLEEKLGLFLEALTTYQSIHALSYPGAKDLPRGLYRRAARREWKRAEWIAKYRQLVMLGEGSIIAQWSRTRYGEKLPNSDRDSLRQEFTRRLRPLTEPRGDPVGDAISRAINLLLDAPFTLRLDAEIELALKLRRWAYVGAEALRRSLPGLLVRPRGQPLTRTTIGLSMACIRRRYELAAGDQLVDDRGQPAAPQNSPEVLERQIRWAHWRRGPWADKWTPPQLRRRHWHEQYNAACLYAIPLDPAYGDRIDPELERDLAKRAVQRLERATACADSSFIDTRRDWVLERDTDLAGLRRQPEFQSFESIYFPDDAAMPRPLELGPRLVESQFTRKLLATLAQSWHEVWHARATEEWEVHKMEAWYSEELELWRLITDVAKRGFDWRLRYRLQERAAGLLAGYNKDPVEVSFATKQDLSALTSASSNGGLSPSIHRDRLRLKRLGELLDDQFGGRNQAQFMAWLALLRRYDAESLPPISRTQLTTLCTRQAAVWQALADWMDADGPAGGNCQTLKEELIRSRASRRQTARTVLRR